MAGSDKRQIAQLQQIAFIRVAIPRKESPKSGFKFCQFKNNIIFVR